MIESALLSWTLTAVFAVTGIQFLLRSVRDGVGGERYTIADRVSSGARLLMSAAMIAMVWPWGMAVPVWPQVAVFALAALWFAVLSAAGPGIPTCQAHRDVMGRWYTVHDAGLMAAMVWMLAISPVVMASHSGTTESGGHHGGGSHSAAPAADVPGYLTAVSLVLVAYCVYVALRWIAGAVDAGRGALNPPGSPVLAVRAAGVDAAHHGAMAAGMAAMLWTMA